MPVLALTTAARIDIIGGAAILLWLAIATMVAGYGRGKGFPFFPLFVSAIFLGPVGWALVLLGIVLAAGPRPPMNNQRPSYEETPISATSLRGQR